MKERDIATQTKIDWLTNYFTAHPGASTSSGYEKLRRHFDHGLNWHTVKDAYDKAHANRKATGKLTTTAKTVEITPEALINKAVTNLKADLANTNTELDSLEISVDDDNNWSVSYQLSRFVTAKVRL